MNRNNLMMIHAKATTETQQPRNNLVRLVVLSDTHNRHKAVHKLLPPLPDHNNNNIPSILLHCGDFADRGSLQHVRSFCRWLSRSTSQDDKDGTYATTSSLPALPAHFQHVVVVDGNHDRARPPALAIDLRTEFDKCNQKIKQHGLQRQVHFLQDDSVVIYGVHLYGVSWKSVEKEDYSALFQQASSRLERPPDVVLSHLIPYFSEKERRVAIGLDAEEEIDFHAWRGSRKLTAVATQYCLPLVLSGHVHWGRGAVYVPHHSNNNNNQATDQTNGSWFVNAANTKPGFNRYDEHHHQAAVDAQVTPPVIVYYDTQKRCVVRLSCPPH